jgi:hypothetical protein
MHRHLGSIHPGLMWEYGPAVRQEGHRLVITPEARRDLRPLVEQILARAPKIPGWEFYAYRLAEDFEMAQQTVEARAEGDIANTWFRASINDVNKIDLTFTAPGYAPGDETAMNAVFVATETLLGEYALDKWIGVIEVEAPGDDDESRPIEELKLAIDALIGEIQASLPKHPYFRIAPDDVPWTSFELKPHEAEDWPGQEDLFVAISMLPAMWINAHRGESFDSVRFSNCGEVFCYVKIDGTAGLDGTAYEDRASIEDALNAVLRPAEAGCIVGGGTGMKYSYVDLALADVPKGTELVRRALRQGKIGRRTWIQFHDSDLQARWIGVWDDSPAPPMIDFDAEEE